MNARFRRWSLVATLGLLLAAGTACKKEEPAGSATTPTAPPAAAVEAPKVNVDVMLAKADAHDGTTDKVVTECLMCGLSMKGDAAHTSTHGGYELHFCSADCKEHFDEGPEAAIAAVTIEQD